MSTETLKISDGTSMEITRVPDIDDETWGEVKKYVESNPETAKALQSFAKNPEAMRGWLQTQAIAEHYNTKMSAGDAPVQDRMKSLESDPELGPIFEDIKKNGLEAALKYYQDLKTVTNFDVGLHKVLILFFDGVFFHMFSTKKWIPTWVKNTVDICARRKVMAFVNCLCNNERCWEENSPVGRNLGRMKN